MKFTESQLEAASIDATLDVFGEVIDAYTMKESVDDEITVPIVYEGRAAKVLLDNSKLEEIEAYYAECAEDGASDYAIEEFKKVNKLKGVDFSKQFAALVDKYNDRSEQDVLRSEVLVCKLKVRAN